MGRLLFIRVSAVTYDETKVPKVWPDLASLVWPDPYGREAGSPAVPVQQVMGPLERGVMELASGLADLVRLGGLDATRKKALEPHAQKLAGLLTAMEKALGNRDAQTAYTLTDAIEETLDAAEESLKK